MGFIKNRIKAILLFLFIVENTYGSGFFLSQIGGPDSSPTEPNPSAIFWNPSALGAIENFQIQLDLISILRFVNYERDIAYQWNTTNKVWETTKGENKSAKLFNYVPVPFLGFACPITERIVLGFGIYSPFGSSSKWNDGNGVQSYHAIEGSFNHYFFSPSISYKFSKNIYGGLTLSYVRSSVSSERKADFSDLVGGLPEDPSLQAKMKLEGFSGNAIAPEAGLLFDLGKLKFGISYQAPISVKNKGLIVLIPEAEKIQDVIGEKKSEAYAEMKYTLPDNIKASLDYYIKDNLRLRGYFEWVNWSRFDEIKMKVLKKTSSLISDEISDKHLFNDAFGVRTQIKYWFSPKFAIFTGLSYDSNAIPDETISSVFIDSEKISGSFGIDTYITGFFRTKIALQFTHFFANDVKGSVRVPSADGKYSSEAVFIDLNLFFVNKK